MSDPNDEELIDALADLLEQSELEGTARIDEFLKNRPEDRDRLLKAAEIARGLSEIERLPSSNQFGAMTGTKLGDRYLLEDPIGAGAMGEVYLGWDERLERSVAIKVLRDSIWNSREAEARFEREARSLAAIRHHAVVAVYDRGRSESGRQFLVMELLVGVGLHEILEAAALEPSNTKNRVLVAARMLLGQKAELESNDARQIATWIRDAARGLHAVHEAGLVHRDLKPSNIFLRSDGSAVLLDLGIVSEGADRTLALDSTELGTPAYMAPEVVRPHGRASVASDVYGLGATLYHSITLKTPYEGTPAGILHKLARRAPPTIDRLRPSVPRDFRAITEKAMSRATRLRYASALHLTADLEAFLEHSPVRARASTKASRFLRRSANSREVRTLAVVALLIGVSLFVFEQIDEAKRRRETALLTVLRRVPPNLLTNERSPEWRTPEESYSLNEAAFANALDTGIESDLVRCFRAFSRSAQDRDSAAQDDFKALKGDTGDPIFAELAEWTSESVAEREVTYLEVTDAEPASLAGTLALALFELKSAIGEHQISRMRKAASILESEELTGLPLIDDLRALTFGARIEAEAHAGQLQRPLSLELEQLNQEALRLEGRSGAPTPSVAICRANCLLYVDQPLLALDYVNNALEDCPRSSTLHVNRADCLERLGRTDEALAALVTARQFAPARTNIWDRHVRALARALRIDEARELLGTPASPDVSSRESHVPYLRAYVGLCEAADGFREKDVARVQKIIARTLSEWPERPPTGNTRLDQQSERLREVMQGVAAGSVNRALKPLQDQLVADPLNLTNIRNFLKILPKPDGNSAPFTYAYLSALIDYLSRDYQP
ncbi:MAG: serine/threonine-protein kinase [Planctomycetota bacterium]